MAKALSDQRVSRVLRVLPARKAIRVLLVRKGKRAIWVRLALPGRLATPGAAAQSIGAVRVIRLGCETASACTAECGQDEVLVTAYCGPRRTAVTLINERSVSCPPARAATNPLVAMCAKLQ